ncbi:MSC_0882 family membrane protein [[Mycoplasma] collis]|uniref:MSC_0882 family membrane protein n=1 Tax=[Mycoplasma] collis TaxID=2127 RepID=UPI00051B7DCB|nr:hypothetical protein [[Mycoplasma] collis]
MQFLVKSKKNKIDELNEIEEKADDLKEHVKPEQALKVFRNETIFLILNLIVYFILVFSVGIYTILLATNQFKTAFKITTKDVNWSWLIIPILILLFTSYKLIKTSLLLWEIKKSTKKFQSESEYDKKNASFIMIKIYRRLVLSQTHHNWLSFIAIFYTTVIASIFYGFLKWKFARERFVDFIPSENYLFTVVGIILGTIILIWAIFSIIRFKRKSEINHHFGIEITHFDGIENSKRFLNRIYLKGFIFSVILIFVIMYFTIKYIFKIIGAFTKK